MSSTTDTPALEARALSLGYDRQLVIRDLDLRIPQAEFTVIVGANACGKSTVLRGLGRLMSPEAGQVFVQGRPIRDYARRELARTLTFLPQTSVAPEGITVANLVARGRHPHQRAFQQWSADDESALVEALAATGISDLATRRVEELSGGQRQRVWVAMALAQRSPIVLLDEPTTFLDVTHQVDLMELFSALVTDHGRTVVAVLHDLNQAARYGTHLIAMADGAVVAEGPPAQVITAELVHQVFNLEAAIIPDPVEGGPLVVPTRRPINRRALETSTPRSTHPVPLPASARREEETA